jgi:hypothetical protein
MEAKELRIGNIVKYENTVYLHGGKITEVDNIIQGETDYYEPIPLTEEWLLKFGFNKEHNSDESEDRDCFYINDSDDSFYMNYDYKSYYGWYLGATTYGYLTSLQYVHQLQNLYFALTGTELEYNERK